KRCVVLLAVYRWTAVSIRVANTVASGLNRSAASLKNACKTLSAELCAVFFVMGVISLIIE
ncbi:hypothetical protein, partial [Klebsiella quasipneumoniae]|uniref:hypothetical protein n=1 Tax=Klebsiella quasipneumoniae TaxID=1463165 RepID=UPI001FB82F7E